MTDHHLPSCTCHQHACSSRREFLRNAGMVGLGIGLGGDLLSTPVKGKATKLTLLHTADIHGQLSIHDELFIENEQVVFKKRGGFATLKTMINQLRKQNPGNTLVIDGGDCFQGSGVAALSEGKAIVPLMNNIGYDIMLPGNWEVVYGKKQMLEDMQGYRGVKVCANMFHETGDEQQGKLIFPPYFVKNIAGTKIGFIGYNDPLTPKRQSPAYSKGIRFAFPEENVARYIKILREQEGCSLVFLLTHMGMAQQVALADQPALQGVDYVLGADTHERVREPIQRKYAQVTEPGAFASFVAKLDIIIENGKVKDQSYQLLDVDPERFPEDAEMKRMVAAAKQPYEKELDRQIGTTRTPLMRYYVLETPMDNCITDALMWKFKPDIAVSNGFRFCPPLVPDPSTGLGIITMDYLWSMLPVDSEAKTGTITGKQLWDWMEHELHNAFASDAAKRFGGWVVRFKGMEVNCTIGNPHGKRVNHILVGGQPLDPVKRYSFVACEREGDPDTTICRFEGVDQPRRLGLTLHKVMEEYLVTHSPIAPVLEGRCTATDAPLTLLTQMSGIGYTFR